MQLRTVQFGDERPTLLGETQGGADVRPRECHLHRVRLHGHGRGNCCSGKLESLLRRLGGDGGRHFHDRCRLGLAHLQERVLQQFRRGGNVEGSPGRAVLDLGGISRDHDARLDRGLRHHVCKLGDLSVQGLLIDRGHEGQPARRCPGQQGHRIPGAPVGRGHGCLRIQRKSCVGGRHLHGDIARDELDRSGRPGGQAGGDRCSGLLLGHPADLDIGDLCPLGGGVPRTQSGEKVDREQHDDAHENARRHALLGQGEGVGRHHRSPSLASFRRRLTE